MAREVRHGRVWDIFPCTITKDDRGEYEVELTDSKINLVAFEIYTAIIYFSFEIYWAIRTSINLYERQPEFLFKVKIGKKKKKSK